MTKVTAAVSGFVAAPVVAALAGALLSPASGKIFDLEAVPGLFPIFFFYSALATLLFGVPAFLLAEYFDLVSWWSAMIAGLVIGALVATILSAPNLATIRALSTMGAIGAVSGLTFWMIWRVMGNLVP